MLFEDFLSAQSFFLWSVFAIAFIMGLVVNKTNFCTMGAISDWVNMGDLGRFQAWFVAIAIVMLGVVLLEFTGTIDVNSTYPPYRSGQLIWARNLLGGILFGIGMTFASGCGNKTLIRFGAGNLKSIFVILTIGFIAYFMGKPFPGSSQTIYSILFHPWIEPLSISLDAGQQDLGTLIGGSEGAITTRLVIGLVLGLGLLAWAFKSSEFRKSFDNVFGGIVVGLCVLAVWYVTATAAIDLDGETHSIKSYVEQWEFLAEGDDVRPAEVEPYGPQSFTFINPLGQSMGLIASGFDMSLITAGIMAVFGIMLGSLVWALISRTFRIEWFANAKDFYTHIIGAVLMGLGGVLALGCTVGQAITGVSTLAVGSFIAFAGIVLGSALTMKVQLYKMMYEEEATFGKALVAGLADLKLLPNGMRQLDKIE